MHVRGGFADVNGTRLCHEVAGSGFPLVLVHGFTLDMRMWDDQFEAFAKDYRVVRYDVRGFGRSALPVSGESYSHIDDLRALLEHLGIAEAYVLGLSMGGEIAIDFALACPHMTRALIPVDSGLGGYPLPPDVAASLESISTAARESGVEVAKRFWLDHPLFKPAFEKPDVASRLVRMVSDYSGWHWLNEDPVCDLDPPAAQQLGSITMPTLAIVGERDLPGCHEIADIVEHNIADARKVILPSVGHMSNMEDPDGFNQMVRDFIESL